MLESIKKFLGLGPAVNYAMLIKQGAVILDVRTKGEYNSGHIKGSVNISIDQLAGHLHRFADKEMPIITCCASGMRSASAKSMLRSKGYTKVYNGGSWSGLQSKL